MKSTSFVWVIHVAGIKVIICVRIVVSLLAARSNQCVRCGVLVRINVYHLSEQQVRHRSEFHEESENAQQETT